MVRRHLLAGLVAAIAVAGPAPAQAALRFERCSGYGYACARMGVPLDRTGVVPGRLTLRIQRLRSRIRPARGVVFVLAGGPGQSATAAFAGDGAGLLYPVSRSRDVIVFDQRGTGRSGALRCRALEDANLLDATVAASRCAAELGPRRALYTTADTVEDMEAIRRALGVERIGIYGTSYGTKVALAYALRYPSQVERLALDSVVEANGPDPLYRDTFAATPRALRALCGTACRSFTRDPVADLERLVARLRRGPQRGRLVDEHGRSRTSSFNRADLFSVLVAGDLDPALRAAFPGAVRSALSDDAAAMLRLLRRAFAVSGETRPRASSVPRCTRPRPVRRRPSRGRDPRRPTRCCASARRPRRSARCPRASSPRSTAPPRCAATCSRSAPPGRWRTPLRRSAPGRCRTCRCCCSRGRTTCARPSRVRDGWPPNFADPRSSSQAPPATPRSARIRACAHAGPLTASSAAGRCRGAARGSTACSARCRRRPGAWRPWTRCAASPASGGARWPR